MTLQQIIKDFNPLSITVYINEHKEYYDPVDYYLKKSSNLEDIDKEIVSKMYELDNVVNIVVYPKNSISFYQVYHYDLDLALEEMYNILKRNQ